MARRPNIERPTSLNLKLPESMRARLDLILWSEVENCVPKGRYQQFFLGLLQTYFEQLKETGNARSELADTERAACGDAGTFLPDQNT